MAGIGRNGWPEWSGMSGRDRAEYAVGSGMLVKKQVSLDSWRLSVKMIL